jgi:hypothetical protein
LICIKRPHIALAPGAEPSYAGPMFTIEHEFDHTAITLIDEGEEPRAEDATILAFEDCVVIEQVDPMLDEPVRVTFSLSQIRDLMAALNLPEGVYPKR